MRSLAGFGVGGGGASGGRDGVGWGEWRVVGEQHRRESGLQLEEQVVGEQEQEEVRLDAVLEVVADRADVERVLDRAVGALGHLELFVDAHDGLGGELVVGQVVRST